MKANLFFAAAVAACATGSVMSMLPDFPDMKYCKKLTLILDPECRILSGKIKITEKIETNDIVGKKLFDMSPFKDSGLNFRQAFLNKSGQYREYVILQDKKFLVKFSAIDGYPLPDIYLKLKSMDNL